MKKLLCAVVALSTVNAFASKNMVTLSGYESGDPQARSLDFTNETGGSSNDNISNIALNYAYAVTDAVQVGLNYKKFKETSGGDIDTDGDQTTIGLQAIYNFANKLTDTSYAAVHYDMMTSKESDTTPDDDYKTNTLGLELGHRYSLGTLGNFNFNYSPSLTVAFSKTTAGDDDVTEDESFTSVTVNFVKFDVLF